MAAREADSTSDTTARMRSRRAEEPSSCARKDSNCASMKAGDGGGWESEGDAQGGTAEDEERRRRGRRRTRRGGRRREAATGGARNAARSAAAVAATAVAAGLIAEQWDFGEILGNRGVEAGEAGESPRG